MPISGVKQSDTARSAGSRRAERGWPMLAGFIVAAVLANGLLTYGNAWPTPGIRPAGLLSIELAVLVLLVGLLARRGRLSRVLHALLAIVLVALMLVHYADVTTEGLLGKPLDVYWDFAHLPNAAAMLAGSSSALFGAGLIGAVAVLTGLFALSWWILRALARPMDGPGRRIGVLAVAGLAVAASLGDAPGFARPASLMIVEQARLFGANISGISVPPDGELGLLPAGAGGDVYVIFFESYAGQVFADTNLARRTSPARARLDNTLSRSEWRAASALVTAPTFGGASWLAHASLLSGDTVDNQRTYNAFLAAPPVTLIDRFREAGYRTVALMPGLIDPWPEGDSLGFDAVYARRDIDYRGPGFGFWHVPDQASLAWLAEAEMNAVDRVPLFVMFPTVMSHMPFGPVPPYQPDWSRFRGSDPFGFLSGDIGTSVRRGFDYRTPYGQAIQYNLDVLGGFLSDVVPPDSLVLVLGDHPPPAIVVGPNTPWSVPVHVFARDAQRLRSFMQAGFVAGTEPGSGPIGETADLANLLLADGRAQ